MDILERAHQAMTYEKRTGQTVDFEMFRKDLEIKIKHPKTKLWAEQLLAEWASWRSRKCSDMIIIFVIGKTKPRSGESHAN